MAQPRITLIVARARNGVIGAGGAIPWRLSTDMQNFKRVTMGKPILMGRKTWDSFPRRPLPGRPNLVLTRDASFRPQGAWAYADLEAMLAAGAAMARESNVDEVCVIGGGQLYDATLPRADRVLLTEVDLSPQGDAFFADLDPGAWRETASEAHPAGPKDDAPFVIRVMDRIR